MISDMSLAFRRLILLDLCPIVSCFESSINTWINEIRNVASPIDEIFPRLCGTAGFGQLQDMIFCLIMGALGTSYFLHGWQFRHIKLEFRKRALSINCRSVV